MNEILFLTEKAAQHIQKLIAKKEKAVGFRLSIKKTGCTGLMYVPEIVTDINPEDVHVVMHQIDIYIDKNWLQAIQGSHIDFEQKGLGQTQLVFKNPNAESLCGCGESFNLKKDQSHE